MKRWLFLILAALILSGCTQQPESTLPPTVPVETTAAPAINPVGYYDPDSALEQSSDGALRVYPLNRSDSYGLVSMGSDLLLLSGSEVTTLTKLTDSNLYVAAAANLDCYIDAHSPAFIPGPKGVTYYDRLHQDLVFLDSDLKEVSRISLPEGILGDPALSSDRKTLYYLTDQHLRAIDLETNLDRLIREISNPAQALAALHCDDSILECLITDEYDNQSSLFLSVKTGETVLTFRDALKLQTLGNAYFAIHTDGVYQEFLVSRDFGDPVLLLSDTYGITAEAVLEMNGAIVYKTAGDSTELGFYDLGSGARNSEITIPGQRYLRGIQGSADQNCVWFLCYDEDYTEDIICRWDLEKTALPDASGQLIRRYTAANPDSAGLAACRETAARISETYGVELALWTSASGCTPENYQPEAEYQTTVIARSLDILDQALSAYPEKILKKAASARGSDMIRIYLVRSLNPTSYTVPQTTRGTQFWDQDGTPCVFVAVGENLAMDLYHQIFHVIDGYVISHSSDFDLWESLNPKGFSYTHSYTAQLEDPSAFFESENFAFIDEFSMTYPREDRATVMKYAMTPGNEAYFASNIMQKKLKTLCHGIRDAFHLKKVPESFLWEQYLAE